MKPYPMLVAVVLLSASCSFGPKLADFAPAHTPNGVSARVTTRGLDMNGELIEVRDNGVVLLTAGSGKLRLIPYGDVRSSNFERLGHLIEGGRTPDSATRERLRLVSRFPQGMSPEVLQTLLKASGQSELLGIQ